MNREVLFRGQRVDNGEWLIGYYSKLLYLEKNSIPLPYIHCDKIYHWYEVIPETVGQYTGLKDKHGKKIFEGDKLSLVDAYNGSRTNGFMEVIFSYKYVGGWVGTSDGINKLNLGNRTDTIEIIGNVHEKGVEWN